MKNRGVFITLEGGDGAGKTTLIEKLYAHLTHLGRPLLQTRAPGGTPLGSEIRRLLLEKQNIPLSKRAELLLFLADRAQHVDEVILPALHAHKIVLCDRFNDSTIAYQGGARGFDEKIVRSLCHFACDALEPDLTLYLDLDPKIGFDRAQKAGMTKDRIESEAIEFHQSIRAAFHRIAEQEPTRVFVIDASLSPDAVFHAAQQKIDTLLGIA